MRTRKGYNPVQVYVRDNDVNAAIRVLKKKMQREGTFREMKRRRSYEKPSERRVRERAEAVRRYARRWESGSSARVTDESSAESCGKPRIEKRREAAAQNRQGGARLDALQVAGSLLMRKPVSIKVDTLVHHPPEQRDRLALIPRRAPDPLAGDAHRTKAKMSNWQLGRGCLG